MIVSEYLVEFFESKGITCVFELAGGMIMQLLDSLYLNQSVQIISMHHEQAAAFAADAAGRMLNKPGIALATSGPGATNLITGIGSCYFDSSPAIFITGQVNRHEQKGDRNIRQLGFQETDIVSMVKPITKFAHKINSASEVPAILEFAYQTSLEGRPGPVLLDIPMDIFRATLEETNLTGIAKKSDLDNGAEYEPLIRQMLNDLGAAKKPLILVGGGVRSSNSINEIQKLIEKLKVPVVSSLMGLDILAHNHPQKIGMIGTYGNRWANIALANSDFVLVLGSRLDVRQTGADVISFKKDKEIYHVDCEEGEINNRIKDCKKIVMDLKDFSVLCNKLAAENIFEYKKTWITELEASRKTWPDTEELRDIKGINPNKLMHQLASHSRKASAYVVDVGQHQMWAAQSIDIEAHQRFITSGGMGAMGFALPAAIGVALSDPTRPVCAIIGDGSFQINIQELQTIARNKLPIKIVIINNKCHGMIRQFQETYFDKRYQSTLWGYSAPSFTDIAHAYQIESCCISETNMIENGLQKLWEKTDQPFLLEVIVDSYVNAYPKLAFGRPISEMEPFAQPIEMEAT